MIGEKLAELMGVKCYDKQLIKEAAKQSGMWEDFLDNMDEKPTQSFLYSVVMDPYSYMSFDNNSNYGMNLNQKAFMATYETIKSIAERESCVIIGRCSNYVLREYDNVLSAFIYAPLEVRIDTVMKRFNLNEKQARDQIAKEDKARASYFNYYTSYKWGKNESYDILIDSSLLGPDGTAELLLDVAKKI
jgi:cytidylate kinase